MGALIVFLAVIFFLLILMNGAPFVTTHKKTLEKIIEFSSVKSDEKVIDLGSGDGRIVIAFAKAGAEAQGLEINPLLVWWPRARIKKSGLKNKARIRCKDFWTENLASFDVITVFGSPHIMVDLEKKLKKELRSGARVVSVAFPFPNWQFFKKENGVYLYKV